MKSILQTGRSFIPEPLDVAFLLSYFCAVMVVFFGYCYPFIGQKLRKYCNRGVYVGTSEVRKVVGRIEVSKYVGTFFQECFN